MTLKEYLKSIKMKHKDFAEEMMTHRCHMQEIIAGHRRPSVRLAHMIVNFCQGHVTLEDLFPDRD